MKRSLILFIILLLPLMSAVQFDMKDELKQGETLITKISGNFLSISKDNIRFYRDVFTAVPFEFEFLKIEDDYFVYTSTLGKIPGKYHIAIEDSEYFVEGGQTSTEDVIKDFSVVEGFADFSVTPGALVADGPFALEIQNLQGNEITIYIDVNTIVPEQEAQEDQGFFSSLFGTGEEGETRTLTGQPFTFQAGETKEIILELGSLDEPGLQVIQLSTEEFSTGIFVYADTIGIIEEEYEPIIKINETEINLTQTNETESNMTDNVTEPSEPTETCEEIGGVICEAGKEICEGDVLKTEDTDSCCIGQCAEKERSNTGKIIGWATIILFVLLYIWFYLKKYRKAKVKPDLLKVAEGKK